MTALFSNWSRDAPANLHPIYPFNASYSTTLSHALINAVYFIVLSFIICSVLTFTLLAISQPAIIIYTQYIYKIRIASTITRDAPLIPGYGPGGAQP